MASKWLLFPENLLNLSLRCLKPIKPWAIFGRLDSDWRQTANIFVPGLSVEFQLVQVGRDCFVPEQTDLSLLLETMDLTNPDFRCFHCAGVFHAGLKISQLKAAGFHLFHGSIHASILLASRGKLSDQADRKFLSLIGCLLIICLLSLPG